ncbi:glutamate synthase large subunit [Portibacter marinus]|uniref:glutamate synthase large subunit n=1 Tax=Portibacter marinus TaxID=2898660 RepID=UPI001F29FA71|nr:glutamate synthase large subunit [Portibacter marinus]
MSESISYGLYTPELEKDACGIGLIANLNNLSSHKIINDALSTLESLEHRGASGYEANTGDGAGILIQIPHEYLSIKCQESGFSLPEKGSYGVAMTFMPKKEADRSICDEAFQKLIKSFSFVLIGTRDVPTDNSDLGGTAKSTEPHIVQIFLQCEEGLKGKQLEKKLYVFRNYLTHYIHQQEPALEDIFYICSCSSRTIIYKGQLTSNQVRNYFVDLQDTRAASAIALVHSRFSTNTIPKWRLAQPFRTIAHNGEINTIQGNLNWWRAKEKLFESPEFSKEELDQIFPVCETGASDSGNFDNVLEFLIMNGRSIPHALMMMIPEAWQNDEFIDDYKKDFYEYHEAFMEPWDGPASICFTDGVLVGATLDRNGLRPSRYLLTNENVLILGSESGCIPVDPASILYKGRLQPGKILIADLDEKRIIGDDELKKIVCNRKPYGEYLEKYKIHISDIQVDETLPPTQNDLLTEKLAFGFTVEDEQMILQAMGEGGHEPIGSMGCDIPLAALSIQSQHISNYFKQQFAQVTNPPIDPIREKAYMSLKTFLGGEPNVLAPKEESAIMLRMDSPILNKKQYVALSHLDTEHFKSRTLPLLFKSDGKEGRLEEALDDLCEKARKSIDEGFNVIILDDAQINLEWAPIPSLLGLGCLHHFLIKNGLRRKASIVVKGGDIIETHHYACLLGYGADAIFPWLAVKHLGSDEKIQKYYYAAEKGLLKVMSKLGVSTVLSYQGSQTFEAIGIGEKVIDKCFKGTVSRISGLDFNGLAKEVFVRHLVAFDENHRLNELPESGFYQWKQRGEHHLFNPKSVHLLQHSTRNKDYSTFKKYSAEINNQSQRANTLRSLFEFREGEVIPLEEVESVEEIMKRFATGAMSFGSISHEAHSTLAIAMNRIGGKSNSGEGGEDEARFKKKDNGDWERSAIKQVASGRFGVTSNYLVNATQLQIKMAQGAKPGEGGQLPGHKVNHWIAKVRHSIPGVGLISPPPHHDIYSIEDLAQLIFDLKNANRFADISVKLVSKAGVGIIASGVAKAHADHILISGHDGGTGASPLSSIKHAGLPWELGLSETHQTLVRNRLRDRVTVQCDGQMKTGRDLAIATLLGAEEWGVATAALVVEGCIMMRKCHLNTCPVGVATQDEQLRKKFTGKVEHLVDFFTFLAQELREIMASLGFKTVNDMVGRADMLKVRDHLDHWKWESLDLSPILHFDTKFINQYKNIEQDHGLTKVLDRRLIRYSDLSIEYGAPINSSFEIKNTDRAVGTMLSSEISKKYGSDALPPDTINFRFRGSAGQSFGAFGVKGVSFTLEGDANDYFGKGLCGAKLIVVPDRNVTFDESENIIIGNVALYGATSGEVYIKGVAGERFAVRNSGATAVVESIGDHGCEYMTGGEVVVLGSTGRNFAAGMSGGIAYIYDAKEDFAKKSNLEMIDIDELTDEDFSRLRKLIRNHFKYTSSLAAIRILNDWESEKKNFVKVFPKEYKKVLKLQEEQKKEELIA